MTSLTHEAGAQGCAGMTPLLPDFMPVAGGITAGLACEVFVDFCQ